MRAKMLPALLALVSLTLSACAVGDGVAHLVKISREAKLPGDTSAPADPPPAMAGAAAAPGADIAPPLATAPPVRDAVAFEELPPAGR